MINDLFRPKACVFKTQDRRQCRMEDLRYANSRVKERGENAEEHRVILCLHDELPYSGGVCDQSAEGNHEAAEMPAMKIWAAVGGRNDVLVQ